MKRERVLKVVLVVLGLLFCAAVYPLMSLSARLGVFLLPASRNPPAPRSLIAFAAWSSFAHASVMAVQAYLGLIARRELLRVATFVVIGVTLIALAPGRQPVQRASAMA